MEKMVIKEWNDGVVYFDPGRIREAETHVGVFALLKDEKGNPLFSPMRAATMALAPTGPEIAERIIEVCDEGRRDQKKGRGKRGKDKNV